MSRGSTIPIVSVIMPAYNAEKYIATSVISVLAQSFTNWELIVVDDGSTDSTATIVKDFIVGDQRIKYLYQENRKLGAARNTGMNAAKGDWISFLDSDDLWLPDKLEKQLLAVNGTDIDFIFTNGYYLHEASQQLEPYESLTGRYKASELYKILFSHNHIPVLSVMMKRTLMEDIGFQDESARVYGCEDWDYWLRCCKTESKFFGLDSRTFKYRVHDHGMSRDVLAMNSAGCYVLFKNYDSSRFSMEERDKAEEKLLNQARHIIRESFHTKRLNNIPYHLKLLCFFSRSKLKCRLAIVIFFILRRRSFRFINELI